METSAVMSTELSPKVEAARLRAWMQQNDWDPADVSKRNRQLLDDNPPKKRPV